MTLPDERYRALVQLPDALCAVAYSSGNVTKSALRRLVRQLLHHYPSRREIDRLAERSPELLEKQ